MSMAAEQPERLIASARAGDPESLDRLLRQYGNYLQILAQTQMGAKLRQRVAPSDLAQDTLVLAFRRFGQFRGATEKELLAWLRRILARRLADHVKKHKSLKRDLRRDVSLEDALRQSSMHVQRALADGIGSPSSLAARRENAVLLADLLAQLPEDYREVLILRHLERLDFARIAVRMGRSAEAVRQLWVRALEQFRQNAKVNGDD